MVEQDIKEYRRAEVRIPEDDMAQSRSQRNMFVLDKQNRVSPAFNIILDFVLTGRSRCEAAK